MSSTPGTRQPAAPGRGRTGRVGMLVAWAWLGLHFFAK